MTTAQEQQETDRRRAESAPAAGQRPLGSLVRALGRAPRRPLVITTVAATVSLLAYAVVRHLVGTSMVDMIVYRAEGSAVAHGHDLYAFRVTQWHLPATYPPFAAMLFVPAAWCGIGFLRIAVTLGNLALLATLAQLSFTLVDWPRRELRPIGVIAVAGFGVWLEPVYTTLRYGQINLALACLIVWDLTRPDGDRRKGIAIGIAAGIKLTPGLFAVYLLLTGRIRAAFAAGFAFLATFAIGAAVLPQATWGFWTRYLYDSSRVGKTEIVDNQSLRGALARALHTPDPGILATAVSVLVAVAGLAVAVWAYRSSRWLPHARAWGMCCAAVTALLVSPISWTHHWVWCVPMLVLLAAEADRERRHTSGGATRHTRWRVLLGATALAFLSYGMWLVPHKWPLDLHLPALHQPPADLYPIVGLCFLLLTALRVRARRLAAGAPLLRSRVRVPHQRPATRAADLPPGAGDSPGPQQAPATR